MVPALLLVCHLPLRSRSKKMPFPPFPDIEILAQEVAEEADVEAVRS